MKVKLLKKARKIYSIYLEKNDKYEDVYCVRDMTDWYEYAKNHRSMGYYQTLNEAVNRRNELILNYCRQFYEPKKNNLKYDKNAQSIGQNATIKC